MASNVGRQYGQGVTTQIGGKYTPEKAKFFDAWARAEGTAAANNPFATTRSGYAGETNFNRVGVKNYSDVRTGLQATYDTLLNGHYGNIVELLKRDDVTAVQLAQAVANSPWGTGAGVLRVLGATQADAYDQAEQQTAFVAKGAAMLGEQAKQGLNLAPQQTLIDSLTRLGPLSAQQGQRLLQVVPPQQPEAVLAPTEPTPRTGAGPTDAEPHDGNDYINPGTSWSGTHVTDGLDWNQGRKTARDIMGHPGEPVMAPEAGTVTRWGSAQGGEALYFQGDSGRLYWLGHIDQRVEVGTHVDANGQLAVISAHHPRPHLHIDVKLPPAKKKAA